MRQHPEVFSFFYVSLVRVGELTGQLDEVFLRLYDISSSRRRCASTSKRRCATRSS